MTKKERDDKIYEWVQLCDYNTLEETGTYARILKDEFKATWQDHLLPDELKKWEELSDIDQVSIVLSGDPINALNDLRE